MKYLLLVGGSLALDVSLSQGYCVDDEDCLVYSRRLENSKNWGVPVKNGGYACLNRTCKYIVSSGNLCRDSTDCSYYSYLANLIRENKTDLFPTSMEGMGTLMQNICSSNACSIASSCSAASNPFQIAPSQPEKCCSGVPDLNICRKGGGLVEVCNDLESSCIPDPQDLSSDKFVCARESKANSQWIGITLALLSAITTNMGLNLQKLALRKRHEKKVQKRAEARLGIFYKLASIRTSISNFYKNISSSSLNKRTPEIVESDPKEGNRTLQGPGVVRPRHVVQTFSRPDKDKAEFQTHVGFGKLLKNPRWMLGMLVFILGNFCNFIALNFAAQSLLAPLNSISLVVNVFVAPLINGETWSWKDIVGIIFIITGSTIVVIFASFPPKDYNLCVLLKLFKETGTIVYLSLTISFIVIIYLTISTVEKNLDLKEAEPIIVSDIVEHGQLVDIVANPENATVAYPEITISDDVDEAGVHTKTLTLRSSNPLFKKESTDSDEDADDDLEPEIPIDPKELSSDVEKIVEVLSPKGGDRDSIHSLSMTFKLDDTNSENVDISRVQLGLSSGGSSIGEGHTPIAPVESLVPPKRNKIAKMLEKFSWFRRLQAIEIIPRLKHRIPVNSFLVSFILPLGYACLGGLMGTLTVLFAKATIHLLTESIFDGNNQFNTFSSYLFTFITVLTAVSQIYWINMGLARYDALLQIPVFYVVWTLFDVIGGGVYYNEFAGFKPYQFVLFCVGVLIIFLGVVVLAGRLKKMNDDDKQV